VPSESTTFEHLRVAVGDNDVLLSRCRFDPLIGAKPYDGKIIFLDDVYDCHALIVDRKVISTRNAFQNLSLVMSKKDSVRPEFRQYAVDLIYELSAYKKFFDEQDELLQHEPLDVRRAAMEALRRGEGRSFFDAFDKRLADLDELVQGFSKDDYERHGFYLRRTAWEFIKPSEFLRRTNLKPRGYAGDADMMVMAYNNEYVGETVFGQLMHKHPLETPAAEAVRARRHVVARAIQRARLEAPSKNVRFLSIASGPATELIDIFETPDDCQKLECVLLDQDAYAFDFSRESVRRIEKKHGQKLSVSFVNESVRTMLRRNQSALNIGQFDVVYSMGLFDYLTPFVAQAVLAKLYEMLKPGGSVVVGNFHVGNPTRHYMAYWMDWVLYHRAEGDMFELASALPGAVPSLEFDPTGCQMFLTVKKT
jgi:extracellular factor (EF) 3-hydroxypalmitic acid methyl ester biosynthesis protein